MATEELIIHAKWHDQGFSAGVKRAQRDLAAVNRDANAINATLGALGAIASQVKAASDSAAFSLGLVAEQLRHIEPAAESALDGLRQMAFGIQNINDAQTAGLSAVAAAIGGIIGTIVGGVGFIKFVVDSFDLDANENFDPTRVIQTIRDPGQMLEGLREFWEELQNSDLENLERYEQLTRRERRVLSQLMTRFEISLLQQKTAVLIAAIEHQRATILNEINDAEEAQRAALKRAIRLDFDFDEAELRARYQPLFAGAGGDQAQLTLLRESAGRDIDALRRDEAATLTDALHELSSHFQKERTVVNSFFGGLIAALRKVIEDLSKTFDNSQRTPITCSGTVDVNVDVSVDVPEITVNCLPDDNDEPITVKIEPSWYPILEAIRDNTALHAQAIGAILTLLPNWQPILETIRDNTALHAQAIGAILTLLPNWQPILETIRDNTALHAQAIGNVLTTLSNWQPILEAIRDNTAPKTETDSTLPNWQPILEDIRDNTATLISTVNDAVNDVINSPDIYGQSFHNRSVRLLLRSINHQLGGEDIVEVLEPLYHRANQGSHADKEKYRFAADPPIVFSDVQEVATPTSLFGYKTFQTDMEKIRDEITTSDTTLKLISTTIPKTENIESKLDSVVTELKNLEKPSYTIGDIHIHVERIDEESAEEIATEIRDRIITEFGENTELRNVRYAYAGTEALT